jgi:hypothetical protein
MLTPEKSKPQPVPELVPVTEAVVAAVEATGAATATPRVKAVNRQPDPDYRKELVQYRSWLHQTDYQTATEYDKQLGILAGGALSISVGYFKDMALLPATVWDVRVALSASWLLFTLTLIAALYAYRPTRDMLRAEVDRTDDQLAGSPDPLKEKALREKVLKANRKATLRNKWAFYFFNAGMLVQFYFLARRFFL